MCGITGFFSPKQLFTETDLRKMTSCLSHRGPDAEGIFYKGICGLGHRRLSIIDLSAEANQPMWSANKRYVCVYNGEIYNFQEIKSDLEKKEISFKTSSDTEVLLELFVDKGVDFAKNLNGIFAIAIYDTKDKKLFIFRDRLGIKPLFYHSDKKNIAFASELKSLLTLNIPKEINHEAITDFLHLGYIPSPDSIFNNIYKLPSGHYLTVSENEISLNQYWNAADNISKDVLSDEGNAISELDTLLKSAVKQQMVADVPLGVFLSGGIDSSTVATLASQTSDNKIKTFSIGFEEERFNEAPFAKQVAEHLQTDHHELIITKKDAQKYLNELIDIFDEPFADSSAIPTMLVSQMAGKEVKVALSGDGGDELFFGYGAYNWAKRLNNPFINFFDKEISSLFRIGKTDKFKKAGNLFNTPKGDIASHIFSQEQGFFSKKEINDLLIEKDDLPPNDYYFKEPKNRKLNEMERQALFDLNYYLQDDLLVKVDRASMKFGLEVRVPLLDHNVVEWALNLSPDLKYKNKDRKYLLKKVLYKYLPEKLFDRPKKGFAIPLAQWLRSDLKFLIDEFLDEKLINKAGIIKYEKVKILKEAFLKGDNFIFNKIWLLIVLHQFLKKYNIEK